MISCATESWVCVCWREGCGIVSRDSQQGANVALSVLIPLTTLTMIFPNVTMTLDRPSASRSWCSRLSSHWYCGRFVFIQTVRHRNCFLAVSRGEEAHAKPPLNRSRCGAQVCCCFAGGGGGISKSTSPRLSRRISQVGAPKSVVGIAMQRWDRCWKAGSVSRRASNRLQISMNLALGSRPLASIGLTMTTAVAAVSLLLHIPLTLGLRLLVVTLILSQSTLGTGRTTVLQGVVHLVAFATLFWRWCRKGQLPVVGGQL